MTQYRIRKRKGSNRFWIEKCIFTLFGIGFFCMPHGKRTTEQRRTVPFYYGTTGEAYDEIARRKREDRNYTDSKSYKGTWT